MIMQELAKIVGEDALVSKAGKEKDRHITGDLDSNYPFEIDEEEYEQNEYSHLHEGDCGCDCEACDDCSDDGSDYSTDSMLANHPLGDYSNLNKTNITPSQAFSAGYEVSASNRSTLLSFRGFFFDGSKSCRPSSRNN